MKRMNKIIPLLLALAVSVNLTACGDKAEAKSTEQVTAQTAAAETKTAVKEYKEAADAGFLKVTLNGTDFDIPCTLSAFTGDFSVKKSPVGSRTYEICYKDKYVASVVYDYIDNPDPEKDIPDHWAFWDDSDFRIGSFACGMTADELEKYFGEPQKKKSRETEDEYIYKYDSFTAEFCLENSDETRRIKEVQYFFEEKDDKAGKPAQEYDQNPLEYPEPQPILEGGWNAVELSKVLWINGNYVSLPCKFSDLGANFEISEDNATEYGNDIYNFSLLYKGKEIGSVDMLCEDKDYKKGTVWAMVISLNEDDADTEYPVAVNGITIGSDTALAEKYFGSSTRDSRYSHTEDLPAEGSKYQVSMDQMLSEEPKVALIGITPHGD